MSDNWVGLLIIVATFIAAFALHQLVKFLNRLISEPPKRHPKT